MRGMTICGAVVEQTSSRFAATTALTYVSNASSRWRFRTSIQPQRAPGHGTSFDTPRITMPHTSPITSDVCSTWLPLYTIWV